MKQNFTFLALVAALFFATPAVARGTAGSGLHAVNHASTKQLTKRTNTPHISSYAQGVKRDSNGSIARSPKAKSDFKKQHPCPSTGKSSGACPGYVIDHIKPLKKGGADAPNNMQWQSKAAAKRKDKTE